MSENFLGSKDVLFEEALLDELFQIPSEGPTIDDLVPFTFVVGAVFLRPGKRRIVLDRLRAFDPRWILEGVEQFVDRELQRSEVFHWSVSSERT